MRSLSTCLPVTDPGEAIGRYCAVQPFSALSSDSGLPLLAPAEKSHGAEACGDEWEGSGDVGHRPRHHQPRRAADVPAAASGADAVKKRHSPAMTSE